MYIARALSSVCGFKSDSIYKCNIINFQTLLIIDNLYALSDSRTVGRMEKKFLDNVVVK